MSKNVTHLIIGLGKGGAETMLYQVLKYQTDPGIQYKVISLGESHFYEQPIRNLGIDVYELPLRKHPITSVFRLGELLWHTDTLCCWMYHANFLGAIVGKCVGVKRIVWNVRHSNLDPKYDNRLSLFINKICAKLSSRIDVIAYNGEKARQVHEEVGYCKTNSIVLDNGVDTDVFCPDGTASESVRTELHIPNGKRIILSVTRDNPIKDIPTFIEAFAQVHERVPEAVAVMCGSGIMADNHEIVSLCQERQLILDKDIYLLGMRNDISRMMAGCDLYVLHSAGEAFPNTLIQAMSCGCGCVATDVGDARNILCDDNWIVPAHDCNKMSLAIEKALRFSEDEKLRVSNKYRSHIMKNYRISETVKKYEGFY